MALPVIQPTGRPARASLGAVVAVGGVLLPAIVCADTGSSDTDAAWALTSTMLLILMAIPALAFLLGGTVLYAYLVRAVGEYARTPQYTSHATAMLISLAWPGLAAAASLKMMDLLRGPRATEPFVGKDLEPAPSCEATPE